MNLIQKWIAGSAITKMKARLVEEYQQRIDWVEKDREKIIESANATRMQILQRVSTLEDQNKTLTHQVQKKDKTISQMTKRLKKLNIKITFLENK